MTILLEELNATGKCTLPIGIFTKHIVTKYILEQSILKFRLVSLGQIRPCSTFRKMDTYYLVLPSSYLYLSI